MKTAAGWPVAGVCVCVVKQKGSVRLLHGEVKVEESGEIVRRRWQSKSMDLCELMLVTRDICWLPL